MSKSQYFDGLKFTTTTEKDYYRNAKTGKRMHVYVWEYYNGKVPKGYEVHHKDFDKSNNDISNLELLTKSEHSKLHGSLLTQEERDWRKNNIIIKAQPKAVEWHKSKDGSKWHSEHIKQQHQNGAFQRELICSNCGKVYVGKSNGKNTFCSNACKSAFRRKSGVDNITKICPICQKEFVTSKYRPSVTCSRSCANKYRSLK